MKIEMNWFYEIRNIVKVAIEQMKLDFHDLRVLAVERVKYEDAFECLDHTREFEKQQIEHIYKMLRAERATVLASTHEPHEISESMRLYDDQLRKKAKLITFNCWSHDIEEALKNNQENDQVIDAKERILSRPYMTADFISRIFLYGMVGLAFGLIGLKICCG